MRPPPVADIQTEAFAVPCHRVLHGAAAAIARRDPQHARRYGWVDYEAKRIAERSMRRI